ncbi:MAG TPA: hypothetical protein VG734_18905 [Lacunisphaera sp.]|nr:hypothetical protein [Lacunisphaera sp.]
MKSHLSLVLCLGLLGAATPLLAYEPLYKVVLKNTPAFEVVGDAQLAFYPFSEQMGAMIRKNKVRHILAADSAAVTLRTVQPKDVLRQILQQISEQTGLKLGTFSNSTMPPDRPSAIPR